MYGKVSLEMSIKEYKVLEEALENYKERLQYLQKNNEDRFTKFQELKDKEKTLERVLENLNK